MMEREQRPQRSIKGTRSTVASAIAGNREVRMSGEEPTTTKSSCKVKVPLPSPPGMAETKAKFRKMLLGSYQQTGKVIKQLGSLTAPLPGIEKHTLIGSYLYSDETITTNKKCIDNKASVFSDNITDLSLVTIPDHRATPFDTLTYQESMKHLTTLRTEHVQRLMRPILQRLLLHPQNVNQFLNEPVDPVVLDLPDYFTRIRHPMDLGTVKSRLQRGFYKSLTSVTIDINLVFKNAMTYNASSHGIHQIAKKMKEDFEGELIVMDEKIVKDNDRKLAHSCTSCQGNTCLLCGEKCVRFETPVMVCHGSCMQRVKRNSIYYVTSDGIMAWCQRCHAALPSVTHPRNTPPTHPLNNPTMPTDSLTISYTLISLPTDRLGDTLSIHQQHILSIHY